MATGGGDHGGASASQMVCAREVLDEKPLKRSSPDEGREAAAAVVPLWADVPADILGTVLRLLPCAANRASVRSVCRHWRDAARVQTLPAPLPVLVLPRSIRFSCLTSDGALTSSRRAQMPVGDNFRIVGSCDDWLMGLKQTGECFLVNAFSTSKVVHLPCLPSYSNYSYICLDKFISVRLASGFYQSSGPCLVRSVLSASPSSVSKYTVAAFTYCGCGTLDLITTWNDLFYGLALWQPGMTTWYVCLSAKINSWSGDLAFYQGKLYMVWMDDTPDIFAFELREDEHGVSLSCPEHFKINPLIPSKSIGSRRCNLVLWRGKLLLIIRFFSPWILHTMERNLRNVEVFALDFSTSPCGVTQIHDFDGDCIFVQKSGCRSFSLDLHTGVQGDLIYFSAECMDNRFPYVYNMRDGTVRRFAAGLPEGVIDFPVWIFPSS